MKRGEPSGLEGLELRLDAKRDRVARVHGEGLVDLDAGVPVKAHVEQGQRELGVSGGGSMLVDDRHGGGGELGPELAGIEVGLGAGRGCFRVVDDVASEIEASCADAGPLGLRMHFIRVVAEVAARTLMVGL